MKETVLQAAMRLSAVDGAAFFDAGVADILTDHIGERLYIRDSAGKTIWGWIKAAGTGETYEEQVTNGSMETGDPVPATPTGWEPRSANATVTSVAEERTGGAGSRSINVLGVGAYPAAQQAQTITDGSLCLVDFWGKNIVGSRGYAAIVYYAAVYNLAIYILNSSWVNKSRYHTIGPNIEYIAVYGGEALGDEARFDDVSLKKVLTPSSTGVTIVSTAGGTTYNWASKDAGFNYNDTTYEISTERPKGLWKMKLGLAL